MTIGHNTVSSQRLQAFVERLENIRVNKRQCSLDEAEVLAEAKADGFVPGAIRVILKRRAKKPFEQQEEDAILETYMHAMGMLAEPSLARQVGLIDVDTASRESVIEALKAFVPDSGSITVEAGGKPVRLTRRDDGEVEVREHVEPPTKATGGGAGSPTASMPGSGRAPPPDVDDGGAEDLGREAFRANTPIIANPFPFGDARRARWDEGWRAASGSDGMGPGGE